MYFIVKKMFLLHRRSNCNITAAWGIPPIELTTETHLHVRWGKTHLDEEPCHQEKAGNKDVQPTDSRENIPCMGRWLGVPPNLSSIGIDSSCENDAGSHSEEMKRRYILEGMDWNTDLSEVVCKPRGLASWESTLAQWHCRQNSCWTPMVDTILPKGWTQHQVVREDNLCRKKF